MLHAPQHIIMKGSFRDVSSLGHELDYGYGWAMLQAVSPAETGHRQRNADVSVGTIMLSLAALSMALFAYFLN